LTCRNAIINKCQHDALTALETVHDACFKHWQIDGFLVIVQWKASCLLICCEFEPNPCLPLIPLARNYAHCLVLDGSRIRFKHDFTIKR